VSLRQDLAEGAGCEVSFCCFDGFAEGCDRALCFDFCFGLCACCSFFLEGGEELDCHVGIGNHLFDGGRCGVHAVVADGGENLFEYPAFECLGFGEFTVGDESVEVWLGDEAWAVEGAKAYFAAGQHVLPPTEVMEAAKNKWLEETDTLASFFAEKLIEDESAMIPRDHLYAAFVDFQRENGGSQWNKSTFMNSLSSHRAFSSFKYGKLRTTGMSLYRDRYGNGPAAPTGGRAAGVRGLRFRTPADEIVEAEGKCVEPEVEVIEPKVVVAPVEPEALIPAEDIPAPTPHVAPEREEVERQAFIEEIDGLACLVQQLPGGPEEVNRLAYETGATSRQAPLGKLRAFKIRLEGALVRLTVQYHKELGIPFAEDSNEHRQE
jgi:hypothetical protein